MRERQEVEALHCIFRSQGVFNGTFDCARLLNTCKLPNRGQEYVHSEC